MVKDNEDIKDEIGLVIYLNGHMKISFEKVVKWASTRYSDGEIFSWVVNESSCIRDAIGALVDEYGYIELSEEKLISAIAEEYFEGVSSVMDAVGAAYNLINTDGNGKHELSSILYRIIDDPCETEFESIQEAKEKFLPKLKNYVGLYSNLYRRVMAQ